MSDAHEWLKRLEAKAAAKDLDVCVVGLGYVGLPLAVQFARSGARVTGIDLDPTKVERINAGTSYIDDVPSDDLAEQVNAGRLRATTDFDAAGAADSISVAVPTPLSKYREPDLASVLSVGDELKRRLRAGQLVVLESTTYPGTTEELLLPMLQESGLTVGEEFFLAFSPERVDPGRRDFMIHNTPRVVGGVTEACTKAALAVYRVAIETMVPVSSARAAEMAKILENTFRSVNIALVNEVALMCDRLDVPVFEVIRAAATKPFGFMPFYPGPGLGGHCLPVDPLYLSWKMRTLDYKARFIELAEEVNRSMPHHVVERVSKALNRHRKAVNGARVLLIGVAYKPDIDDVRESPAADVIAGLRALGADVRYHDPFVPEYRFQEDVLRSSSLDEGLDGCDCAVIVTNHSGIDYRRLVESAPVVVDARNATEGLRHLGDVVSI